jgi:hypothetical protein
LTLVLVARLRSFAPPDSRGRLSSHKRKRPRMLNPAHRVRSRKAVDERGDVSGAETVIDIYHADVRRAGIQHAE